MSWRDIYAEQNLEMAQKMLQQQGQLNDLRTENQQLREENRELRKQVATVKRLHFQYRGPTDPDSCAECNRLAGFEIRYPCPTIAALGQAPDGDHDSDRSGT